MVTQNFLESLLFILDKNIQEVPQLFQHSYTGIGLRILQLHSLTSGRPDKIIFSSILNPGYVNVVPHVTNTEKWASTLRLIEKCLLIHRDGKATVRLFNLPRWACHVQSNMFQLQAQILHLCSSTPVSIHILSFSWWGCTLLQILSTRPQTQTAKYIKGDKGRRGY